MIECVKCRAKATLFLCPTCIIDLHRQLLGLPTFVDYLHDSAVGATKLSENAGRHSPATFCSPVARKPNRHRKTKILYRKKQEAFHPPASMR